MRVARTCRLSLLSAVVVVAAQFTGLAAANATPNPPTVSVTSPASAADVSGLVNITGTGTVDTGDTATTLQLLVDDSPVGSTFSCPAGPTCTHTFSQDFSGLSGGYTVSLRFVTTDVATPTVDATDVPINVSTVAPTVVVTTPLAGATLSGPTDVRGTGTVDGGQNDWPISLTLYDNSTVVGTYNCPSPGLANKTCTVPASTFSVDYTGRTGGGTLRFDMATNRTAVVTGSTTSINISSPSPTSVISSPTAGSTVAGLVHVTATGTVDSTQTDYPVSLTLCTGTGTLTCGTPQSCGSSHARVCTLSTLSVDFTAQAAGSRALTVRTLTHNGLSVDSAAVGVNLLNPPPTAVVNSPADGSSQSGVIAVSVTGAVDASQTDTARYVQLVVDGSLYGTQTTCPATASCTQSLTWDATGLTGPHTVAVKFTTTDGLNVTSAAVNLTIASLAVQVSVTSPSAGSSHTGAFTVTGQALIDASQNDTPLSMQLLVDTVPQGTATPCAVNANPKLCLGSFTWDSSGLVGAHSLAVRFTSSVAGTTNSPAVSVSIVNPAPVVSITSPAAGATVSGTVSVGATAQVNAALTDSPASLSLFVDGQPVGGPVACVAGSDPRACALGLSWDSTGATGTHALQVRVATALHVTALSPVTSVTVVSPAPTAAITSPAAGSTVSGIVSITGSGQIDASQTDTGGSLALTIDGAADGAPVACPAAKACSGSFSWDTAALSGSHTLTLTFTSANGVVGTSSSKVLVFSKTRLVLSAIARTAYGHLASVKGRVTGLYDGSAVPSDVVDVTFAPTVGPRHTVAVRTDSTGHFAATYKVPANTVVTATLAPVANWGTSSASGKVTVTAGISCARLTVRRGALATGVCKMPNVAKGTKVSLQQKVGSRWVTIGSARTGTATVTWSARFSTAGSYAVRLVSSASKRFVASTGAVFTIVAR